MDYDMAKRKPAESAGRDLVEIEAQRAIQEVQAAMVIAKRFPRDEIAAFDRIMEACERPSLAKEAAYAYPRGGQLIEGPSIRLAEVIAQNWGNIQYGVRELAQYGGFSEMEAYAWDLETNTRRNKTFKVPHSRYSKKAGVKSLKDPRDIYEHNANMGARRERACVLGVIPRDVTEKAMERCQKTLQSADSRPIVDRVREMVHLFKGLDVSKAMLESRVGHKLNAMVQAELISLGKIYNSLKDGMSKPDDWFDAGGMVKGKTDEKMADLKAKIKKKQEEEDPHGYQYKGLKSKGFRGWVFDKLEALREWPEDELARCRDKWGKLFADEPFPPDIAPEATETGDKLPAGPPDQQTFLDQKQGVSHSAEFVENMRKYKEYLHDNPPGSGDATYIRVLMVRNYKTMADIPVEKEGEILAAMKEKLDKQG